MTKTTKILTYYVLPILAGCLVYRILTSSCEDLNFVYEKMILSGNILRQLIIAIVLGVISYFYYKEYGQKNPKHAKYGTIKYSVILVIFVFLFAKLLNTSVNHFVTFLKWLSFQR